MNEAYRGWCPHDTDGAVVARGDTRPLDALIARVRTFVEECAIPREDMARSHDVDWLDAVTRELRAEADRRGLSLPQLPRERGGLGLTWVECVSIFGEAGRSVVLSAMRIGLFGR